MNYRNEADGIIHTAYVHAEKFRVTMCEKHDTAALGYTQRFPHDNLVPVSSTDTFVTCIECMAARGR